MELNKMIFGLYINPLLGNALYGNNKFLLKMQDATFGKLYECSWYELKENIKILEKEGYKIIRRI